MKKVAFHNLGCKVNAYEMELMQQNFTKNGYEIVSFSEKADIYIVNTCTVTNIADRKSRQMLHRARALNPAALVVAAGCYVETDRVGAKADEAIDLIISNKEKADVVKLVEEALKLTHHQSDPVCTLAHLTDHARAFIKIQDGCDQYCSYCIIPLARGHVVSRSEEEILKEITDLSETGCKEFVITGIHLSSYGLDRSESLGGSYNIAAKDGSFNNTALTEIIKKISKIDGVERIRLGSLEPRIITEEFLAQMAAIREFCPHFHLSLQSGSDTVLKRMNRRYDTEEFFEKVQLIRKYSEHPAITTDIIVGFPGETQEEFDATRKYLEKVDLYETHVFAYSRRRGTTADKMPGQHTQKTKSERSRILMEDAQIRSKSFREYYIGRPSEVLIEEYVEIDGRRYGMGYNKEYVRFAISCDDSSPDSKDLIGHIVTCTGEEFLDDITIKSGNLTL